MPHIYQRGGVCEAEGSVPCGSLLAAGIFAQNKLAAEVALCRCQVMVILLNGSCRSREGECK